MRLFEISKSILNEGYDAYVLPQNIRSELKKHFPPKYPEWIGHHATLSFGKPKDEALPYDQEVPIDVIGYAEDDGIEALVIAVNGEEFRPDGKRYHITWSLDRSKGRKPVHSNDVIASQGFDKINPIRISGQLKYIN
jgi:hypothetical protein